MLTRVKLMTIDVPQYEGSRIDDFIALIDKNEPFVEYFPDKRDFPHLPREWIAK